MEVTYKRLDSLDSEFADKFSEIEEDFYAILLNSYNTFYGREYHQSRIKEGQAIIYLAFVKNKIVGVSYVKRNLRRGNTTVFPENFRRLGIAENLVKLSLIDFPRQYTILTTNLVHSHKMLSLMGKVFFKKAISEEEIKSIVGNEFRLLLNFRWYDDYFVFDRISERRNHRKEFLTLLHTF